MTGNESFDEVSRIIKEGDGMNNTGYTANLDTFAMSRHTLAFNSLALVDGVLVGLDETGAFALDGTTDGESFTGTLETGWTDFAEFNQNPNVKTL